MTIYGIIEKLRKKHGKKGYWFSIREYYHDYKKVIERRTEIPMTADLELKENEVEIKLKYDRLHGVLVGLAASGFISEDTYKDAVRELLRRRGAA